MSKEKKSYFFGFLTVLIWGSFIAISKINLKELDSFQVLFYTSFIALVTTFIVASFQRKLSLVKKLSRADMIRLSLYSLPAFLYYLLYYLALRLIPTIEAAILNYLWPLAVVIFALILFKEKITKSKILAIIVGLIGSFVVVTKGNIFQFGFTNYLGDLLAVVAAFSWGLFSNLGKRNALDQTISYLIYFLTIFLLSIPSLLIFSKFTLPSFANIWGLLWIGTLNLALAYQLWFKALKLGDIAKVSNFMYLTPFVALVWIALLLGENITFVQLLGLSLIMIGPFIQNVKLKTSGSCWL